MRHQPAVFAVLLLGGGCGRVAFDLVDAAASDATASSVCSTAHVFCEDFDRTDLLGPWMSRVVGLGTLAIDGSSGNDTPGVLRVELPPQPSGPGPSLFVALGAPTTRTRVRVDLKIDTSDTGREVDLLWLRHESPPPPCTSYGVYLVKTDQDDIAVQETYEGCGGVEYHPVGAVDAAWHRYELVVNHGDGRISATRDGIEVLSVQASMPHPAVSQTLNLGGPVVVNALVTTWTYRFDDVVVDYD